jgi:hypothetical protein
VRECYGWPMAAAIMVRGYWAADTVLALRYENICICMYVCVCVCVCVCMYICIYMYVYMYIHAYIHI